jgi:DNA-binding NtrC family response regulator
VSEFPTPRILVVDDDKAVRTALKVNLGKAHQVTEVDCGEKALKVLAGTPMDLVLTDVAMPGMGGMALMREVRDKHPEVRIVVMTGYGSVADAVDAMKAGADDYLIKPIEKAALLLIVEKALEKKALLAELVSLRQEVQDKYGFENLIGTTPAMLAVYEQIEAVADSNARVLVEGPTGTGKELISLAIHYRSGRRNGPIVRVNCAALPENLLESELFGHEKGAFTSAVRQHRGKFEQANGGTLFLDEIAEVSLATQAKLLRVLESGEFQRVGGTGTIQVDVRVITATNKDLRQEVQTGNFREDLYYRLNVFRIEVPALAERKQDIPLLVAHFLKHFSEENGRAMPMVSNETMHRLLDYSWPGNVRELLHVIERAVILSKGEELTGVILPEMHLQERKTQVFLPGGMTLQAGLKEYERQILIEALKSAKGVQAEAARCLGLSRSNLNYRINRLGISVKEVVYE